MDVKEELRLLKERMEDQERNLERLLGIVEKMPKMILLLLNRVENLEAKSAQSTVEKKEGPAS